MDGEGYWTSARRLLSRRRLLATSAVGTAGLANLLAACGRQSSPTQKTGGGAAPAAGATESPQTGGTFNYYLVGNPPTLDPHRSTSGETMRPAGAVYSRLFRFKTAHDPKVAESKEIENDLAVSAESADAVTWTVKLRTDAKFHNVAPVNGHDVQAEDVKQTLLRAIDSKNPNGGSLDMIDGNGIQTPAPDTVVLKLKYPFAALPSMLGVALYGWILPREAVAGAYDPAKQMIGSGPFILDNYTPDVAITFKRNPNWFEKGLPYVDALRLAIVPDAAQRAAQFTGGNLDQSEPEANAFDTARRNSPKADLLTGSANSMNRLLGKLGDPTSPWSDIRVRQAFSMAMDRSAIGASVMGGKFQYQALLPLSLGKWSVKPEDLDPKLAALYKYDPAQAKQLLSAAGVSNLSFKFVYAGNNYPEPFQTLAQTANSMLNTVGVKTTPLAVDYNAEYVNGGKGYQAGVFGKDTLVFGSQGGTYTVIDEILFAYYDSQSRKLPTQLSDPTLDAMISKARGTLDENERLKAYQDVEKYLIEKTYYVTGWPYQPAYTLVQPWVHNFTYTQSYGFPTESVAKLWIKKT
jgi:peptide/nickel transport system substrate-binding protein